MIGSTCIELLDKLKNPMKHLTNTKNSDSKSFLLYHMTHLNPLKIHPESIAKVDKKIIDDLDYEGIKFPISKKDYCRIERQNNIYINVFYYQNNLTYPVYVPDEIFENCMDFLLISDENHIMCISKILTGLYAIKQKIKIKNIFANVVYNVLVEKTF